MRAERIRYRFIGVQTKLSFLLRACETQAPAPASGCGDTAGSATIWFAPGSLADKQHIVESFCIDTSAIVLL